MMLAFILSLSNNVMRLTLMLGGRQTIPLNELTLACMPITHPTSDWLMIIIIRICKKCGTNIKHHIFYLFPCHTLCDTQFIIVAIILWRSVYHSLSYVRIRMNVTAGEPLMRVNIRYRYQKWILVAISTL